jgi:putative selenium metabolism hydrolase
VTAGLDVVALCRDLVRIPSPSGEEGAIAAFVAERMEAIGLVVETDRFGSVLGRRDGGRQGPTLLLDAHLDTVPVPDPAGWTRDPLGGEVAEGRLWGRGAADTKGSLAAMLCAAETLERFAGTLLVSASVGEEDLTTAALGHVLDRHGPDLVVVGEPTSLRLGVAQKGRAGVVVEALGRSAHSSRPELGVNAVYRMTEAIARVRALPLAEDPDLGRGVCELIEIRSEPDPSPGMVPHRCVARFALRLLPGEAAEEALARIAGALRGLDGVTARLARLSRRAFTGETLEMEEAIPGWRNRDASLEARLLAALGTTPFAAPYTTNASAAASRGIPTFLLGPGSIDQAHAVDEGIDAGELAAAPGAYLAVARAFLAEGRDEGEDRKERG